MPRVFGKLMRWKDESRGLSLNVLSNQGMTMLSQEQLAQYDRDGYVLVSGLIPEEDNCQCGSCDVVCARDGSG